jgi:dimethylamine corrinoid protein
LFQILLKVHGFQIHDLGVDVAPDLFLAKAMELKPIAVGLSCLMVGAYNSMRGTVAVLRTDPATASIPIVIGGQVNADVCQYVGADHWAADAMDGVNWCLEQFATRQ